MVHRRACRQEPGAALMRAPESTARECRKRLLVLDLAELKQTFKGVEYVSAGEKGFYLLNIGGNKYRLITSIHFNRGKVYVRHILTHQEYDRGAWKK